MKNMTINILIAASLLLVPSCSKYISVPPVSPEDKLPSATPSLQQVARLFASLPIGDEQIAEVYDAVSSSSQNGYDEEYTMKNLFESPGCGVGDKAGTKAGKYEGSALRDMIRQYLEYNTPTKASVGPEEYIQDLVESGYQLYWPYSEDWDKTTFPIITFDPGYGSEVNEGYELSYGPDGNLVTKEVVVDENVAKTRPVWVINTNDDSAYTPLEFFKQDGSPKPAPSATNRMLMLKSFKMLRNYDSWFGGASEFFIKCGSVNGFSASTEAELKLYSPSITDFLVVVRRKYHNKTLDLNAIIMTDFTNQLENLAFLITEDDGGTQTSWKCSATVKIKSKSYGFEVDLPYKQKDDIVWRGQLSASFFQSADLVVGRFGDVEITFALE